MKRVRNDEASSLTSSVSWTSSFNHFVSHRHFGDQFILELNTVITKSYLLLDEYMRFIDKGNCFEKTLESILKAFVAEALSQVERDVESFKKRGGIYDWQREAPQFRENCGATEMGLDW